MLSASYFFYGCWDWRFLLLIAFSSLIDYILGMRISISTNKAVRKKYLIISLILNLGLLFTFKYFGFFSSSFADLMYFWGWQVDHLTLNLILPVGISFFTFQSMSYTIDVYRKKIEPTKDAIAFFTFISFFPQLVAGPIERASNLIPQILSRRSFSIDTFKSGIFQILIGLFRKIVIADNIAIYVDHVFGNVESHNSITLLITIVFYAFQIYFDFSGYSDMAIGSAKLLGFRFKQNFNFPYFSKSLTEFWRKWHISLSHWLRDYLYISLGGNRRGIKITYQNLMITMLLGGLWHGSSLKFVIWGGIHGVFLVIEKWIISRRKICNPKRSIPLLHRIIHSRISDLFAIGYTFSVVIVAWVFFRASDLNEALLYTQKLFSFDFGLPFLIKTTSFFHLFYISLGVSFDYFLYRSDLKLEEYGASLSDTKFVISISWIIILSFLFYSTAQNFIYFQF